MKEKYLKTQIALLYKWHEDQVRIGKDSYLQDLPPHIIIMLSSIVNAMIVYKGIYACLSPEAAERLLQHFGVFEGDANRTKNRRLLQALKDLTIYVEPLQKRREGNIRERFQTPPDDKE